MKIKSKSQCTGCYACVTICPNNCITMVSDKEGFEYPKVNKMNCINCNLCEKICPVLYDGHNQIKSEPIAYAAFNKNEEIRMQSSSGGIFTLLAESTIQQGGVVFGACFNKEFEVVHDYVEKAENLSRFRGSKYVQSKIGNSYKQVEKFLIQGRYVLFTGTPCQIGGLHAYLGKAYRKLFVQDIICHGVPSKESWRKYIDFHKKRAKSNVRKISFKDKSLGWKKYAISIVFDNNIAYQQEYHQDLWMKAYLMNINLRPSCYTCQFKSLYRASDITLADYWGIQNIAPDLDDDRGISLMIINSEKGIELFDKIKDDIVYQQHDLLNAIEGNPHMLKSATYNTKRNKYQKLLRKHDFETSLSKIMGDTVLSKLKKAIRRSLKRFTK